MKKLLLLSVLCLPQFAFSASLEIKNAWVRALPPGVSTTAIYMQIANPETTDDKLLSVQAAFAEVLEFHETIKKGGMASMEERSEVIIPAKSQVGFLPGGLHIMAMGLKEPLKEGLQVPIILKFEKAGTIKVIARIKK